MGMPLPTRSGMGVNIYIPFPSLNPAGMGAGFPTIPKEQTTFLIRPSDFLFKKVVCAAG